MDISNELVIKISWCCHFRESGCEAINHTQIFDRGYNEGFWDDLERWRHQGHDQMQTLIKDTSLVGYRVHCRGESERALWAIA